MHYPCCSEKIKVLVSNVMQEVLIRNRMFPETVGLYRFDRLKRLTE